MKKILAILAVLFLLVGCVQVSVPEAKYCVDKQLATGYVAPTTVVVEVVEKTVLEGGVVFFNKVVVNEYVVPVIIPKPIYPIPKPIYPFPKPTTVIIDKSHVHINNNNRDHVNINGNKIKSNNKNKNK